MDDKKTDQTKPEESAGKVPVNALVIPEFNVNDFVYHDSGNSVGQISDIHKNNDGDYRYRINYCQFKDADRGTCGGNGPIFKKGYPVKVTEPVDVLFVAAMKERIEIKRLKNELKNAESNFAALKKSQEILGV